MTEARRGDDALVRHGTSRSGGMGSAHVAQRFLVRERIGGEEVDRLAAIGVGGDGEQLVACRGGEAAPGLEHDGGGAGDVPERRTVVVHDSERAHGDVAEVQRRRAHAAQPVASHPALDPGGDTIPEGRPHGEEGARAERCRLEPQLTLVAPGAFALRRAKELVGERIVDRAREGPASAEDPDRDGEAGNAASEVIRAVKWIQHPHVHRVESAWPWDEAFLAEDTVLREGALDLVGEPALDLHVRVGDHGVVTLPVDLGALEALQRHLAADVREPGGELGSRLATPDPARRGAHATRSPARHTERTTGTSPWRATRIMSARRPGRSSPRSSRPTRSAGTALTVAMARWSGMPWRTWRAQAPCKAAAGA